MCAETGLIKLDELRKTAESFGDDYFKMDYFKRVGLSLVELCIQRKIFNRKELVNEKKIAKKNFEVPILDLPDPKLITHLHDGIEHKHKQSDFQEDEYGEGPPEYYFDMLATAQILHSKNIISIEDIQKKIDNFERTYPARGISVVTKAWTDSAFRAALINDAKSAIYDMGIHLESFADIICFAMIVEHTMSLFVHYALVTLEHYSVCLLPGINHEATGHELSMNLAEFLKNLELLFLKIKRLRFMTLMRICVIWFYQNGLRERKTGTKKNYLN